MPVFFHVSLADQVKNLNFNEILVLSTLGKKKQNFIPPAVCQVHKARALRRTQPFILSEKIHRAVFIGTWVRPQVVAIFWLPGRHKASGTRRSYFVFLMLRQAAKVWPNLKGLMDQVHFSFLQL